MAQREISCGTYRLTRKDNSGIKCIEVETGRELTFSEKTLSKEMFGNNIDYTKVRIYDRKLFFKQGDTMAIAPNGSIYFAPKVYKEDFSLSTDGSKHFFIHEMTHVWQYQNNQAVMARGITTQMLIEEPSKALRNIADKLSIKPPEALVKGIYPYELDPRKNLLDYGLEQQAAIVADYWALKNGKSITSRASNLSDAYLTHYKIVVDTVIRK